MTWILLYFLVAGEPCGGTDHYSEVRLLSARHYADKHNIPQPLPSHDKHTAGRLLFSWDLPAERNTTERRLNSTIQDTSSKLGKGKHFAVESTANKTAKKAWRPEKTDEEWFASGRHKVSQKSTNDEVLLRISPIPQPHTSSVITKKRGRKHRKNKKRRNKNAKKSHIKNNTMRSKDKVNKKETLSTVNALVESTFETQNTAEDSYKNSLSLAKTKANSNNDTYVQDNPSAGYLKSISNFTLDFKHHHVTENRNNTKTARESIQPNYIISNYNKNASELRNHTSVSINKEQSTEINNEESKIKRFNLFKTRWNRPVLLMAGKNYSQDDINECLSNNGGCEGLCINLPGSYRCHCPPGFRLDSTGKKCLDMNECLARNGHGPCQGECVNLWGSYRCSCVRLPGTRLAGDGRSCQDIDECDDPQYCSHGCTNTLGSAFCLCPHGYTLGHWRTCHDVDECVSDVLQEVKCKQTCVNTVGSYHCLSLDLKNF